MNWIEEITIEDIDEQYRNIARLIGIKNFIKLIKLLGGTSWYIPKVESVLSEARKRRIKKEYNGYNKRELALKYGVSERTVAYITKDKKIEQLKLF